MKLLLQRVTRASVCIDGITVVYISKGLLILFGAEKQDTPDKVQYLVDKVLTLRIFPDDKGKMNHSCLDIAGEVLVISQFTLVGDCTKGRRPDFAAAAKGEVAKPLYEKFVEKLRAKELKVETGEFAAMMEVNISNQGPITIIIDTKDV